MTTQMDNCTVKAWGNQFHVMGTLPREFSLAKRLHRETGLKVTGLKFSFQKGMVQWFNRFNGPKNILP